MTHVRLRRSTPPRHPAGRHADGRPDVGRTRSTGSLSRRTRAWTAALSAFVSVAAVLLPASPAAAAAPSAFAPRGPLTLTMSDRAVYRSRTAGLDGWLFTRPLASIVRADLGSVRTGGCSTAGIAGIAARARAVCLTASDARTLAWIPQGVTGPTDALTDRRWGNLPAGSPLVMSWYSTGTAPDQGVRITFVDPRTKHYRHALLVRPTSGNNYTSVRVHAGGIAWYGRYLYVADTAVGLRVFDLSHIYDLDPPGPRNARRGARTDLRAANRIGRGVSGSTVTYYSYGYRFVVPQIATWRQVTPIRPHPASNPFDCTRPGGDHTEDRFGLRFSWVTVDRVGGKAFAAGEYCRDANAVRGDPGADNPGRAARWSADAIHRATLTPSGRTVRVPALSAVRLPAFTVQGAAHAGRYWYFNSARGCRPGQQVYRHWASGWRGGGSRTTGTGAEDLAYDASPQVARPALWSLTEDAGSHRRCANHRSDWRIVYAQYLAP